MYAYKHNEKNMRLIVTTKYVLEDENGVIKEYQSSRECEVDNANAVDYVAELNAEALAPMEKRLEQDITKLLREEDNF